MQPSQEGAALRSVPVVSTAGMAFQHDLLTTPPLQPATAAARKHARRIIHKSPSKVTKASLCIVLTLSPRATKTLLPVQLSCEAVQMSSRMMPSNDVSTSQVLDAPNIADDFYLNLLEWSRQNVLAVGLGTSVYLWSASTAEVHGQHSCMPRVYSLALTLQCPI